MRARKGSIPWKVAALLLSFSAWAGSAASAQTLVEADSRLESVLSPGTTAWITDSAGREEKTRIVDVSGGVVTTETGNDLRQRSAGDIMRVRVRQSDSVLNGALIGAGSAVALGLFLCTRTEPWENCRDDVGPVLKIAAVGAGIGIAIDALVRGRKTIYEAGRGSARLSVAPLAGRRTAGLRVALTF